MITRAIEKSFEKAKERWWDKTFWGIDIHDSIIVPNYRGDEIPTEWYPFAKEGMLMITNRKDICPFLYTCSWPKEIVKYRKFFSDQGINFEYANENPEVKNDAYGYYRTKPYFNVLFEDKAGFDPIEWEYVIETLKKYPEVDWSNYKSHFTAFLDKVRDNESYWIDEITLADKGVDRMIEILREDYSPYRDYERHKKIIMVQEYLTENQFKFKINE